jgi:predicted lipoprotein with Yx(FWY)xxD motif
MTRSRTITFLAVAAVVALAPLAVSACGSSGGGATASTLPEVANGQPATVGVASGDLGKILVDSQGRTLYLFQKDAGTKSACFGECASDWPPLRAAGKPTVGSGADSTLVGTAKRSDGKPQVTYNGHPLYLYAGDGKSGDTNGQGLTLFGGAWYALSPAGDQVSGQASSSGGGRAY